VAGDDNGKPAFLVFFENGNVVETINVANVSGGSLVGFTVGGRIDEDFELTVLALFRKQSLDYTEEVIRRLLAEFENWGGDVKDNLTGSIEDVPNHILEHDTTLTGTGRHHYCPLLLVGVVNFISHITIQKLVNHPPHLNAGVIFATFDHPLNEFSSCRHNFLFFVELCCLFLQR
jgi:hypothetical protein